MADPDRTRLGELAALFLRLGSTAFGGPAAHIGLMQGEVRRRGWMSDEKFLDLVGATNLIPGPNSTELAMHLGYERRGFLGLVVAGASFIVPAALITGALAWVYVHHGTRPEAVWLLYGVKPVMLAVVVQAIWRLLPKAARTTPLRLLGAIAALAVALGGHELMALFATGFAAVAVARLGRGSPPPPAPAARPLLLPLLPAAAVPAVASAVSLPGLFGIFLKIGAVLFGSGYVLLAFLRADLVERLGWLTEAQLIDAIAIGQVTPGPVFSTATFIGYVLAGSPGAAVATIGIFLPAFVFVSLSGPLLPRLRASPTAAAFLDGVNVASLALMAVVTVQLGHAALVDVPTVAIGVCAAALLVATPVNPTWLIAGGAAAGGLAHLLWP
jgi:chromate transporter